MTAAAATSLPSDAPLDDRVAECFERNPRAMTMMVARELGEPEAEVVRCLPALADGSPAAVELDATRVPEILESLIGAGMCHVIVSNGSTTMESQGRFGGFTRTDGWLNVQTSDLDLHILLDRVGSAFAVTKASHMNGRRVISVQLYDVDGNSALKAFLTFGQSQIPSEKQAAFDEIVETYALQA